MAKKKVLITGAAGRIGGCLRDNLADRYDLRLMYHHTVPPARPGEDVVVCGLGDLAKLEEAVDGADAVVHMAGDPYTDARWESILESNIIGVYHLYEATKRQGVKRIVFASTNHVTGFYEQEGVYTTPDMLPRPDSFYGVSKSFGEDLGRYYVDQHGLEVICLRIGSFQPATSVPERARARILSTWLSHRDCVQLVWRSIEATDVAFGIFYGISANKRAYWDIQNARDRLGYAPQDDAERLVG